MSKYNIKNSILNRSNIPKDVVWGVPVIYMVGNTELYLENHNGILEYTPEYIRIQSKIGKLEFHGSDFVIEEYDNDEMKITGKLFEIEYKL